MNAKQEAKKCKHGEYTHTYGNCTKCDKHYTDIIEDLQKELEATERKLAEADNVVMHADMLQKVRMSGTYTFIALTMADNELNVALQRYKDYEASKE